MPVLLTGSSGWLGRFLGPRLRRDGHEVIGLDVAEGRETQILGSVADPVLVQRIFETNAVQAVIHAGALHKPDIERFAPHAFVDVNVTGTLNLLAAAVAAGVKRFVFTSTTSLMISHAVRQERSHQAVWLDESSGPLEPRNIYGVTKLTAEGLCRIYHQDHGLNCIVLRTGRFFPEDDDTLRDLSGLNLKANEFLNRRLTVEDAAEAHVVALTQAERVGFGVFIISAPPPFTPADAAALKGDAAEVISRYYPDACQLYAEKGWRLPASLGRVYDPGLAERVLGFRCKTDFAEVLAALRSGASMPFAHDPSYTSPTQALRRGPDKEPDASTR